MSSLESLLQNIRSISEDPERLHQLEQRLTPDVRTTTATAMDGFAEAMVDLDLMKLYQNLLDYTTAGAFGEKGIESIDWTLPPIQGKEEQKRLQQLDDLSAALYAGSLKRTKEILAGFTDMFGSYVDAHGLPECSPEILCLQGIVKMAIQPTLEAGVVTSNDWPVSSWADAVAIIHDGYESAHRELIAQGLFDAGGISGAWDRQRETMSRLASGRLPLHNEVARFYGGWKNIWPPAPASSQAHWEY